MVSNPQILLYNMYKFIFSLTKFTLMSRRAIHVLRICCEHDLSNTISVHDQFHWAYDESCAIMSVHKIFIWFLKPYPGKIYLFKVNNRTTRKSVKYVQS